jgi:hypothetical protein
MAGKVPVGGEEQTARLTSFPLMHLPQTVRDIFYYFALVVLPRINLCAAKGHPVQFLPGLDLPNVSLFLVSRKVNQEAARVFYSQNRFTLPGRIEPRSMLATNAHRLTNVRLNCNQANLQVNPKNGLASYCPCVQPEYGQRDNLSRTTTSAYRNPTHERELMGMVEEFWHGPIRLLQLLDLAVLEIDVTNCICTRGCCRVVDKLSRVLLEIRHSPNPFDAEDDGITQRGYSGQGPRFLNVRECISILRPWVGESQGLFRGLVPRYPRDLQVEVLCNKSVARFGSIFQPLMEYKPLLPEDKKGLNLINLVGPNGPSKTCNPNDGSVTSKGKCVEVQSQQCSVRSSRKGQAQNKRGRDLWDDWLGEDPSRDAYGRKDSLVHAMQQDNAQQHQQEPLQVYQVDVSDANQRSLVLYNGGAPRNGGQQPQHVRSQASVTSISSDSTIQVQGRPQRGRAQHRRQHSQVSLSPTTANFGPGYQQSNSLSVAQEFYAARQHRANMADRGNAIQPVYANPRDFEQMVAPPATPIMLRPGNPGSGHHTSDHKAATHQRDPAGGGPNPGNPVTPGMHDNRGNVFNTPSPSAMHPGLISREVRHGPQPRPNAMSPGFPSHGSPSSPSVMGSGSNNNRIPANRRHGMNVMQHPNLSSLSLASSSSSNIPSPLRYGFNADSVAPQTVLRHGTPQQPRNRFSGPQFDTPTRVTSHGGDSLSALASEYGFGNVSPFSPASSRPTSMFVESSNRVHNPGPVGTPRGDGHQSMDAGQSTNGSQSVNGGQSMGAAGPSSQEMPPPPPRWGLRHGATMQGTRFVRVPGPPPTGPQVFAHQYAGTLYGSPQVGAPHVGGPHAGGSQAGESSNGNTSRGRNFHYYGSKGKRGGRKPISNMKM